MKHQLDDSPFLAGDLESPPSHDVLDTIERLINGLDDDEGADEVTITIKRRRIPSAFRETKH